jgi:hypothetical protein
VLAWTWPTIHGPFAAAYDLRLDGVNSRVACGSYVRIEGGPIRNPVSGAEAHPRVVLPEGIILKEGELGATTHFSVTGAVSYDHSGQYLALGPFDYSGSTVAPESHAGRPGFRGGKPA